MPQIAITDVYIPGALGRLVEMHARYYAREWGFGPLLEAKVAGDAAAFLRDLPHPDARLWTAVLDGRVVGAIAIDGRAGRAHGAHLRWFVVDDDLRGAGGGARMLGAALAFCRARGFAEVYLWTFAGLDAARSLYERNGFQLVEEVEAQTWGTRVREQRFVLKLS